MPGRFFAAKPPGTEAPSLLKSTNSDSRDGLHPLEFATYEDQAGRSLLSGSAVEREQRTQSYESCETAGESSPEAHDSTSFGKEFFMANDTIVARSNSVALMAASTLGLSMTACSFGSTGDPVAARECDLSRLRRAVVIRATLTEVGLMLARFRAPKMLMSGVSATGCLGLALAGCSSTQPVWAPAVPSSLSNASVAAKGDRSAEPAAKSALTVLWSFGSAPDGSAPAGAVIVDNAGNVFGTTIRGGSSNDGAVFEIKPPKKGKVWTESILHSFDGTDGTYGAGAVEDASGNLFVSASQGGSGYNDGTVMELSPSGGSYAETGVFSFNYTDGAGPLAAVLESGTLYTATQGGGTHSSGAIVALTGSGLNETDLYNFTGGSDGNTPFAGLVADSTGALYGTTGAGGTAQLGNVFKFVPNGSGGGTESVLWSFVGNNGGAYPRGGVVLDGSGNIYGTTFYTNAQGSGNPGAGIVFKLTPNGSTYTESILHAFSPGKSGEDGAGPTAGLTLVGSMLYGTTTYGGTKKKAQGGTVFQVSTSGTNYAVLHSFEGSDGSDPTSPLSASGEYLYGTTFAGGSGHGVVFRLPL